MQHLKLAPGRELTADRGTCCGKNVVVHLENDDPLSEDPFFL